MIINNAGEDFPDCGGCNAKRRLGCKRKEAGVSAGSEGSFGGAKSARGERTDGPRPPQPPRYTETNCDCFRVIERDRPSGAFPALFNPNHNSYKLPGKNQRGGGQLGESGRRLSKILYIIMQRDCVSIAEGRRAKSIKFPKLNPDKY